MKKCQICGKRASMFLTQIVNGQVTELALCEECARKRGLFDPQALTFSEKFFPEALKERVDKIVRELVESAEQAEQQASAPAAAGDMLTQCPVCGFSLESYRKTGRFGCPDCYSVFARELEPTATAADDGTEPADPASESAESLEQQLRAAIAREDYETAATLRDRLRSLKDSTPEA